MDAARLVDPPHPRLGARVRREQASPRVHVLDHGHFLPVTAHRGDVLRLESQFTFRASEGALTVVPPAIFSALYAVLGKSYLRRYPPFTFVARTLLIGTVLLLPLLIVTRRSVFTDIQSMGLAGWIPVLYLGIFPTFVGYGIWFRALERIPAASAGAYIYASTLVAVIGGIVILGESLTGGAIAGGAMVIAGVVLAQQFRKRPA